MGCYLYEGRDESGRQVTGRIEAESPLAAIKRLESKGVKSPSLLSQDSPLRHTPPGQSAATIQAQAQQAIKFHKARTVTQERLLSLRQTARSHWIYLCLISGLAVWNALRGRVHLLSIYPLLFAIPFVISWWRRRHLDHYRQLQTAMCYCQWSKARSLIGQLRKQEDLGASLQWDMDVREAQIRIREGQDVDKVIASLEPWRARLAQSPGAFEGRLLSIWSAAHDYRRFIESAKHYHQLQPQNPSSALELALAEARFGDKKEAKRMLAAVDAKGLTAAGLKFLDWVQGLIALREGNLKAAEASLLCAKTAFKTASEKKPTTLSAYALSSAAYGLTLARQDRIDEARKTLREVMLLLQVCGDLPLMQQIHDEIGEVH